MADSAPAMPDVVFGNSDNELRGQLERIDTAPPRIERPFQSALRRAQQRRGQQHVTRSATSETGPPAARSVDGRVAASQTRLVPHRVDVAIPATRPPVHDEFSLSAAHLASQSQSANEQEYEHLQRPLDSIGGLRANIALPDGKLPDDLAAEAFRASDPKAGVPETSP